jgi:phytoene/squalene synthetase
MATMQGIDFYQGHLDRVSRSFAYCISRLEGSLRTEVSLSYLLCRLLDTVEDAPWKSASERATAFREFFRFMESAPSQDEVRAWLQLFPSEIEAAERLLLLESHKCFSDFHNLSEATRSVIRVPVLNMARGMEYYLTRPNEASGTGLRLKDLAEVNQYCFFVAGLVGDLLHGLVQLRDADVPASKGAIKDAHHFGLFLQKVNLLKDQWKDEKEGRFLVPGRNLVAASLLADAQGAIRYLLQIPSRQKGYRLFCAWSLFLGLSSLPLILKAGRIGSLLKLPRFVSEAMFRRVEGLIDDNIRLLGLFQELLPVLPEMPSIQSRSQDMGHVLRLYQGGRLAQDDLLGLGLSQAVSS